MDINLSDMNMTPDQLETADAAAGWNLIVPQTVERRKGVARWLEFVTVTGAYRSDDIGEKGQTRLLLVLETKVGPGGTSDENVGRTHNIFLRLNPAFVNGKKQEALGEGDARGETMMHSLSMKKLKQIMVAAGISLSQGLTAEIVDQMFPLEGSDGSSVLLGVQLALNMADNERRKTNKDENSQEAENILPAPEGV